MPASTTKLALLAGTALLLAPAPALADTLKDALVGAYQTNPTLQAARADQRATDENVPINRASGLPSVSGTATYTEQLKETNPDPNGLFADRTFGAGITLSVPV
ncbi:MAG: Type secretion outer membrane protein, TolC, partial [Proteobacteria bacterium]|nr:Type secretion outer membrane protein, TolC [Pseudomonadota bacterium]